LYEGFGFPVVESMACGTPVITSNNSSLAEIGADAALLLENPEDPVQLKRAIEQVSQDAVLRAKLSQAGKERAGHFIPEVVVRPTVEAYRKLLT
jgi:glycosyltransferase involved in cell wall biosynthesis